VLGVYEAKPTPSGLSRNIAQCLDDFSIPLYTNRTVSRVFGRERLTGVEIATTDEAMRPIPGTEERITCDGLILSVGLIPENELAESLGVPIHPATKGPVCDQHCMTEIPGVFSCGNAMLVNDLVDYVSESGEEAGKSAAHFAKSNLDDYSGIVHGRRNTANFEFDSAFLCISPQRLDLDSLEEETTVFFRSREELDDTRVTFTVNGKELFTKQYSRLRPPEMERIGLCLKNARLQSGDTIKATMERCQ